MRVISLPLLLHRTWIFDRQPVTLPVFFMFASLCAIIERKRPGKEAAMRLFIDDETIAEMKKALRKDTNVYRISMMGFG